MKISEIAEAAGVSVGTVDRVLHNRGRVSPNTKAKIEKIIKDNGYTPNILARNLKTGAKLKFGILIPKLDSEDGYWYKIFEGIKKGEKEIAPYNITIEIQEFDRSIENSLYTNGKKLIAKKVDVIALAPIIIEESIHLINELEDIPYAFFDSSLANTKPIITNIQIPYKAGWCAARLMKLFSQKGDNYICIQMHKNAYNQESRAKGFIDYFKENNCGNINTYVWDRKALNSFTNFIDMILLNNPKIDGIFITNDATGLISKYIDSTNPIKMPNIIGFDLVENSKEELKNGNISALISQAPKLQGYNTIIELFRILFLKQKITQNNNTIPINIILKENLL